MRQALCVSLLLAVVALLGFDARSSAGPLRRRHAPPCCPCCPCVCPPAPAAPAAPVEVFVSPKGRPYRITWTEQPPYEFDRSRRRTAAAKTTPTTAAADTAAAEDFDGTDRGLAKTSTVPGQPQPFETLNALLDELAQSFPDDAMRSLDPPISKAADSPRLDAEKRNVTVPAWLYAAKKEDDNDYHLIIGTDPTVEPIRYFNVEITGLPATGPDREALRVPREAFKDFLRGRHKSLNPTSYLRFEDPVPLVVTGPLFYDIDHAPGVVGSFKEPRRVPSTAWEIHPVTVLVLEP